MSSTFSVDTPLMATAADLDEQRISMPSMELDGAAGRTLANDSGGGGGGRKRGAGKARTEPLNPLDNTFKRSKYPANVVSNN
ncbi:hypothetical protein GGI11_008126, partial [Coemansia sp. RSA 2049]